MMKGRLYIDGDDAYMLYGAYIVEGGWNELVAYPPLKPVETNDWHEEDGVETDLSSPALNSREFTLRMAFSGDGRLFINLTERLSDGAYHIFDCASINRRYRLRLVSQPSLSVSGAVATAALRFADDFPMQGYVYSPPYGDIDTNDGYSFDGFPFSGYGAKILQGTLDEVMKVPNAKPNLLRNANSQGGAVYDGKNVTYKSKDVRIYCLMRADTLAGLWRNYDALLYDLVRPGERMLETGDGVYPFHYKSCVVSEFYPDGRPWLRFDITLVFTSFRLGGNEFLLAAEDGRLVALEADGDTVAEVK